MSNSKDIKKDLDTYKSLSVVAESDGGKVLIEKLNKTVVANVDWLANNYKTAQLQELVSRCADIKANLDLIRTLNNAKTNSGLAKKALEVVLEQEREEAES